MYKNRVKLSETKLRNIVAESVKKLLKEYAYDKNAEIISLAIDEAYKKLHEDKNNVYDIWNIGMRLYHKIDELIKQSDREIKEPNTDGRGFYDDVLQDEMWYQMERG